MILMNCLENPNVCRKFEVPSVFASLPSSGARLDAQVKAYGLNPFAERLLLTSDVPYQCKLSFLF